MAPFPARALALAALASLLAASASPATELGPRLRYLRHLVASGELEPPARVAVSLLTGPGFDGRQRLPGGVELRRAPDGSVLRTERAIPVLASLAAIEALAELPGVELVETSWFPRATPPPLDVSRVQLQSPELWTRIDAAGIPLVGYGVTIADFDTGVDPFHPHFFHADGGLFAWLDVDASSDFTPGVDAVDLDASGTPSPEETLRILEAPLSGSYPTPNAPGCDADLDWLWADSDGDGRRDFGRAAGFTDASPGFGEPLFVVEDTSGNNRLDPGERLVLLGSSKIRAVRELSGNVRRRGVDLIDAEGDAWGHGTQVSGILAGGIAGHSRFAGLAPGAELLMADMAYPGVPPFEDDMASLALWAKSEGARVMLYESGNWVWAWLDGSHPNEVTMTDLAREGFLQLTPTGNLSGGGQQQTKALAAGVPGSLSATSRVGGGATVVWPSLLWRGLPADASVTLEVPGGATLSPCYCASAETVGAYTVYSDRTVSPRGTTMLNYEIKRTGGGALEGTWVFHATAARDLEIYAYSWDDRSGWSGNTRWDAADNVHTVTQPATGDVSIAVAAHDPRSCAPCPEGGGINGFSGRGTRIDGVSVVDLATPGSTVFSAGPLQRGLGAIVGFGGTSSALPHAAGAAALLVQLNPNDPHEVVERILRASALVDSYTGTVPNDTWGMGKLRILDAYGIARKPSILREDSLRSLALPRSPLFPGTGPVSLTLAGPNGYSKEGEGIDLATPGATDGDAFLAAHVDPGWIDPEGSLVVSDASRPLVFYQATTGAVLHLVKDSAGLRIEY